MTTYIEMCDVFELPVAAVSDSGTVKDGRERFVVEALHNDIPYIVQAINCHDELVDMLDTVLYCLGGEFALPLDIIDDAKSVLERAKLKGGA